MSTELTRPERHPMPVPIPHADASEDVSRPAPPAPDAATLAGSTTYGPHDRVPLADGDDEC